LSMGVCQSEPEFCDWNSHIFQVFDG
jgi:hypothetical protein